MTELTTRYSQDNSVKMLLTTGTPNPIQTVNSGLSSPTGDTQDESVNKLMIYLHRLAGNHEIEIDVVMKDHSYARPWNWKPESLFVRPAKKLFFPKTQSPVSKDCSKQDDIIDVENIDTDIQPPPYDMSKVRQSMDEFQRVANFIRSEDTDDWEEKIDKILWSPVQNRIFNRVVRILNSERMARLSKEKSLHEPILRRTSIDSTAKKLRETLASANWDWRITQWLHSLLFDHLPHDYLTIYLDVLQTLRQKIPQLIDKMITAQPNVNSKSNSVTWETLMPLLKKTWDPVGAALNSYKPKKLPGNPILIVIPNGMPSNMSSRQHKWITQLGMLGLVVTVNTNLGLNAQRMTVLNGVEQIVQAARTKIQDVKVDYPNRPVVLIGFNTGAAIACQIGISEHASSIVCLGFPLSTADGRRGTPDDLLLNLRCPVLFIVGENATLSRLDDVEELRERMLVPTGLVVVGSADDQLRISTTKKITERISQSIVDRCVLDELADFVAGVLTQPSPVPVRSLNAQNNCDNKHKRANDARKRKNSTSSSVDSEPQSPNLKKMRPHSPSQANVMGTCSNISANALPRGTLVKLTGTTATQTPRRKPRANFQKFSEQQATSRLTAQSMENSSGGITLNIGSLASLSPMGPIRFESSPISLQVTQAGGKASGTIKTSANTFIKVPKGSHQVNVPATAAQGTGKIKMLLPTKKPTVQRAPVNYKSTHVPERTADLGVLSSTAPAAARVSATTTTVTNTKISAGSASHLNALPSIQTAKNTVNSASTAPGKQSLAANIHCAQKNSPAITMATTVTPNKVADSGGRKQAYSPPRAPRSTAPKIPPSPKSSLHHHQHHNSKQTCTPGQSSKLEKSPAKITSGSTDTSQPQPHPRTTVKTRRSSGGAGSSSLDDGLENILDIPIIIAKDGESLSSLEQLSGPTVHSDMPPLQVCSNKLFLIDSSRLQQQSAAASQIKYTKIILTKRSDEEGSRAPIVFGRAPGAPGKLLLVEPKSELKYVQPARISLDYLAGVKGSNKNLPN